jgi:MoaA/NifB/PqqE/SkfB family radical SAM enzyme
MSLRSLYILLTNYCPLNCAHCAIHDQAQKRCDLNMDIVEQLIHDSSTQQFSISIISGGGEPMAVKETVLTRILQASSKGNLYPKMTTNSYWATSFDEACYRLRPLVDSGLRHLVLSVSESHQEYVKYDNILNAVRAANTLNLKCELYVSTLNIRTNPLQSILQHFKEHHHIPPLIHAGYYFIPFGNAEANFDLSDFQLTDIANLQGACPSAGNNICVHPSGAVTFCAMVFAPHVNALHVGNVYHDHLADIMQKVENNKLIQWLSEYGIVALKELVEKNTDIRFANQYVNICHLCCELLRNPKVLQFLQCIGLINIQER